MGNGQKLSLAENASATGSAFEWRGGSGVFIAEATWGGGTAKLQIQSPNGTWVDVDGISLTANGTKAVSNLPAGQVRVNIATATAVYAYLVRV